MEPQRARASRDEARPRRLPRSLYFLHAPEIDDGAWGGFADHAAALRFEAICLSSPRPADGATDHIGTITAAARGAGLALFVDHDLAGHAPADDRGLDPRRDPLRGDGRLPAAAHAQALRRLAGLGIDGVRLVGLDRAPVETVREVLSALRVEFPGLTILAWTPGTGFDARAALRDPGVDAVFSSIAWWNFDDAWLAEERRLHRAIAPEIGFPEAPFAPRLAAAADSAEVVERRQRRALRLAAEASDGLLLPMGFEFGLRRRLHPDQGRGADIEALRREGVLDLCDEVASLNAALSARGRLTRAGEVASAQGGVGAIVDGDAADLRAAATVRVVAVNADLRRPHRPAGGQLAAGDVAEFLPLTIAPPAAAGRETPPSRGVAVPPASAEAPFAPGEVRVLTGRRSPLVVRPGPAPDVAEATRRPRVIVEAVTPVVDGGASPAKRIVGDVVTVAADVFTDGHDPIAVALFWRAADEDLWREAPMTLLGNDRWSGRFRLDRVGRHEFAVEAWRDAFATYHHELEVKAAAGLDVSLELEEGRRLVAAVAAAAPGEVAADLTALAERLRAADDPAALHVLTAPETAALMAHADPRPFRVRTGAFPIDSDRIAAGFSAWYELFPRSQSGDPARHGTFGDVVARLPAVRDMGFDVLYFPPIHPIGTTNRKGRNNTLTPGPDDPGSPYAIGSEAGGHDAIHPELGTFEDFRRLVAAAADQGLEIAIDFAIQASPDHPWLTQHPGWFAWRPDGSIRYAENPPKKYEDIVNVDFYGADAVPDLWVALRDVVRLWIDQGVRLFRVDNPHTKPFPFWEWLIADVRRTRPDVVFLAEAFTRPKVMYGLAKAGFSQSYTYFTWRDTKAELTAYLEELTQTEARELFRPHFFVNTPDINPDFLQDAPRPAYLIRAALAATLSGLWGVYNGFELCEGRPDAKRKEYADSEKYEIRAWDWDRPGNIAAEIGRLNRIRRANPALHSHLGLSFLPSSDDAVLWFEKATAERGNVVLVAVSLDPNAPRESLLEVPLWKWSRPDDGRLAVTELMSGRRETWQGKHRHVRLETSMPFAIWRAAPAE